MRISRNQMLMEMATIVSKRSTCLRLQVGAVIALQGRILSMGYVGAPSGMPHCTPDICNDKSPCERTIHAEANAIAFAAREGIRLQGSTMYCTHSPCMSCAKLILNTGIVEVIYLLPYRLVEPVELLRQGAIICYQYDDSNDQP